MNKFRISLLVAAVLLLCSCKTATNMEGNFVAGSNYKGFQKLSEEKVQGSSCRYFIGIVPLLGPTVTKAGIDAISQGPVGTEGLSDIKVTSRENLLFPVPILFWSHCYYVEGYPAKRIGRP